jgi:tRNA pseudouridine13 synthase
LVERSNPRFFAIAIGFLCDSWHELAAPMLPPPVVRFKSQNSDFIVEEIDAYPAAGDGDHTFVRFRKTGLNTEQAVRRICEALSVSRNECGVAGQKDRDAITTQRASFFGASPPRVMELAGRWPDLEILEATAHRNKLKTGHLRGNRFVVTLREVPADSFDRLRDRFAQIVREGLPNFFGQQRFGRAGDNDQRALDFVLHKTAPPRNPQERRFLFSAMQSRWFNRVLERRIADGSWLLPQTGDWLQKNESGGMFQCTDPVVDRPRVEAFEISITGPIFGAKMRVAGPPIDALEAAVLAEDGVTWADLNRFKSLGEGTRRPLREQASDFTFEPDAQNGVLRLTFTLKKGVYATTMLQQAVELSESKHQERRCDEQLADQIGDPE